MPKKKHPRLTLSCIFAASLTFFIAMTAVVGANILTGNVRTVVITDNGERTELRTRKTNVEEILLEAEVELEEHDYISINPNEEITEDTNNIQIKRAVPITVVLEEETLEFHTLENTVGNALDKEGIEIDSLDEIHDNATSDEISESAPVTEDMEIRVVEVTQEETTEEFALPYEKTTRQNSNLDKGKTKVVQQGTDGLKRITFRIRREDGVIVSKEQIGEEIIAKPVNEITEVGTQSVFETNTGELVAYDDAFVYEATAYTTASDPYNGLTATGARAKVGIVAVDRKVIPLGTKLYVESLGSMKDYGYCIAGDTGVIGERIDLYYNTLTECYNFGRRDVRIYVLKDQSIDVFANRS